MILALGVVVAQVGAPPDGSPRQEGNQLGEDSLSVASRKEGEQSATEDTLEKRQRSDLALLDMIQYIENNILPGDDQSACTLILHRDQYTVVEGLLYHLASDKTLCVVVPDSD